MHSLILPLAFLLHRLADEGEDEEREDRAPDEGAKCGTLANKNDFILSPFRLSLRLSGSQIRKEVHLQRLRQTLRRGEGEVDVARKQLGNVGTRYLHALGQLRLRKPKPLHLDDAATQERADKMVGRVHRCVL